MNENEWVAQLMEWMDSRDDISKREIQVGYSYWAQGPSKKSTRVLKIDKTYPDKIILPQAIMEKSLRLIEKIPRDEREFCQEEVRNNSQVWVLVTPTKENLNQIEACIEDTCDKLE